MGSEEETRKMRGRVTSRLSLISERTRSPTSHVTSSNACGFPSTNLPDYRGSDSSLHSHSSSLAWCNGFPSIYLTYILMKGPVLVVRTRPTIEPREKNC